MPPDGDFAPAGLAESWTVNAEGAFLPPDGDFAPAGLAGSWTVNAEGALLPPDGDFAPATSPLISTAQDQRTEIAI